VEAKVDFKTLHKEKIRLEKERGAQLKKIESWTDKCNELQMLKFGRLIDLDVLEAGSDRTKEEEAEMSIAELERAHHARMSVLESEYEVLKSQYAQVRDDDSLLLREETLIIILSLFFCRYFHRLQHPILLVCSQ
jgi:hypothetical protein